MIQLIFEMIELSYIAFIGVYLKLTNFIFQREIDQNV